MIVFSGVDGSGKSTLSRLLASHISTSRVSTRVFWLRGSHLVASLLLRFFSHLNIFKGSCNPYYKVCIPEKLKILWVHIEFWSLIPYVILRSLLSRFHILLISDRGLLDFIVWIVTTLHLPKFTSSIYGRFLLGSASREFIVYLHADPGVLARRADVPTDFLRYEYTVYSILSKYYAKAYINTSECRPIECLTQLIQWLEKSGFGELYESKL
ncbi:MAG: hypothetical protein ABWJ42_03260 [Sulfolobales archaeon]